MMHIDNFIAPYSDMDRPALGTILSLSIVKPQWIPNRQGHRRLIWIVNMPQDDPAPEKTSGLSRSNLEKLKALHDKLNS
ncbi:MAG: hypothetical protein IJZ39_05135 [Oscillospiraceae bacterium]|nr:hypothetical protein [Oscillospiraceae bacterium]